MIKERAYHLIGAAIGNCGPYAGPEQAPAYLQNHYPLLTWKSTVQFQGSERKLAALPSLVHFSNQLAHEVATVVQAKERFCVIGGDHACAIGTWMGVAQALQKPFGLIWIDAHLDAHTPTTSHSKNPHGMPVAALLGYFDMGLVPLIETPFLKPEHLVMIGVRSYEPEEQAALQSRGVKIYYMPEVESRGFDVVLQEAHHYLMAHVDTYGITLDIDGIDPRDCNATGSLEKNGIRLKDLLLSFKSLDQKALVGIEIAEFNPLLGDAKTTSKAMINIYSALESLI